MFIELGKKMNSNNKVADVDVVDIEDSSPTKIGPSSKAQRKNSMTSQKSTQTSLEYEYATGTTLHGLNKIADASRLSVRVLWSFVVLVGAGLMMYNIVELTIDYFEFSPVIEVTVKVREV